MTAIPPWLPANANLDRLAQAVADEIDGIAGLLDVSRMDAEERRIRLLAKSSVLQMRARNLVDPCWVARAADRKPADEP